MVRVSLRLDRGWQVTRSAASSVSADSPGLPRVRPFSQLGDKLDQMALLAMLGTLRPGGSGAFAVAQLAVVFTLPVVLFGPSRAFWSIRWNRRTTLVACDVLRAGLVARIPFAYQAAGTLWAAYPIVFMVFLAGLVFNAAKMAVIPDLVAGDQLLAANAAVTFIGRFATVAGIVGGGLVVGSRRWSSVGWSGYEAGFYLDALSFAVSAWTLAWAVPATRARPAAAVPGAAADRPALRRLSAGAGRARRELADAGRLIAARAELRFVFATVALVAATSGSLYVLAVIIVQAVMGLGTGGLGLAGGIGATGMIAGLYLTGVLGSRWPKGRTILAACVSAGLLLVWFAGSFSPVRLGVVAFLVGVLVAPILISQDTWLHQVLPDRTRGRVFAFRDLLTNAAFAAAAVVTATALAVLEHNRVGNPPGLVAAGTGGLLVLLAFAGCWVVPAEESAPRPSAVE